MQSVLRALAEPRRLEILKLIREGEMAAGQIAEYFDVTRPAISQHLRVLVDAGLVNERREGTKRIYRLHPQGLKELRDFLEGFWEEQLHHLKLAVENVEAKGKHRVKRKS